MAKEYDPSETGAQLLEWFCENDDGKVVRNGVYVTTLKEERSGRIARQKFAVVK